MILRLPLKSCPVCPSELLIECIVTVAESALRKRIVLETVPAVNYYYKYLLL